MTLTDVHIEAIKAAALPIDYGSITIHIGATSPYLDMDVHHRSRIYNEPNQASQENAKTGYRPPLLATRGKT